MTAILPLKITQLNGTPVFVVPGLDHRLSKVFGATKLKGDPLWYYPAFYPCANIVLRDFQALELPLQLSPKAEEAIAYFNSCRTRIENCELPDGFVFKTKPFQHQIDGLVHLIYHYRAGLLYGCGLGKSKIIIDWQRAVKCWPLILCPKVVLHVWSDEAQRHGIDQEYAIIDATSTAEKTAQIQKAVQYSGVVVTYDTAKRYMEALATLPYDAIVADESHYIKDVRSQRSKTAIELSRKASRRVIMSGTADLGDPRDMYPQMRFLGPVFMPENYWHFMNRYCVTAQMNKHIVVGFKNLDVLHDRVALITIRRQKEQCLDLPEQLIIDLPILLEGKQRQLYNLLIHSKEFDDVMDRLRMHDAVSILKQPGRISIPNAAILLSKLLQITAGFLIKKSDAPEPCNGCEWVRECIMEGIAPYTKACRVTSTPPDRPVERLEDNTKLDTLLGKLDEILVEPNSKVIVWGQFIEELNLIEDTLKEKGEAEDWHHVRVDGSVTSQIQKIAAHFNEDPKCRVYLGQVETGVGVTLNAANYMVYYSLPWKLGAYLQSLDRNYRIGQKRNVTVLRLLGKGTVDEDIAKALDNKSTVAETIMGALQGALSRVARPIAKARELE